MGYFVKNRALSSGSTSIQVPSGTSADRPLAPKFGAFRYNTTAGYLEYFNGTEFKSLTTVGETALVVDSFTGDNSTTTFTMSQETSSAAQILVFIGSVYQIPITNYSISADDIIFSSAPPSGEPINIVHNIGSNS